MINEEYLEQVAKILEEKKVAHHLQLQILDTVSELLEYYSIDFVSELLPSLLER